MRRQLFLDSGRDCGIILASTARNGTTIVSLAMQHGCPIDRIKDAVTREEDGEPAGLVGTVLDHLAVIAA